MIVETTVSVAEFTAVPVTYGLRYPDSVVVFTFDGLVVFTFEADIGIVESPK